MWSSTNGEDVTASLKRLKDKIIKTSNDILEHIVIFSYPPMGMSDKEFVKIKIEWLIENNRVELIEDF